jgi:phage terminase Nu1 subunit (DNA packaging protein)
LEIFLKDGKWLANQQTSAKWLGLSLSGFQKRGYEPVAQEGRQKLYDVRSFEHGDVAEVLDFNAERTRLTKEQADKTEMENRVKRGELLEVDEVTRYTTSLLHSVKSKLLALPSQLSQYLAHKEPADIESQLADAVYDSLTELVEELGRRAETTEATDGQ